MTYDITNDLSGAGRIALERRRQIDEEGWTPEHDREHAAGELASAASCYLNNARRTVSGRAPLDFNYSPPAWPWDEEWWKPSHDPIKDLVRAGALIAAEIDRYLAATRQHQDGVAEAARQATEEELRDSQG